MIQFGFTPLYYASQNDLIDVIKTLTDHGLQTDEVCNCDKLTQFESLCCCELDISVGSYKAARSHTV